MKLKFQKRSEEHEKSFKTSEPGILPIANPAKNAVPRLVMLSVCLLRSICWLVKSAINCTIKLLLDTPPSTLEKKMLSVFVS